MPAPESLVELRGVGRRFGGTIALADVTLTLRPGAVHAFVGENGAGKSTAGKIVAGVIRRDEGDMRVDGHSVSYRSPHEALHDGIAFIAQELALVPNRTVLENVFLGREPRRMGTVDQRALRLGYAALTERVGISVPAEAPVRTLRVADQQKVEILRALARDARLIVMDEPTAALSGDEVAHLKHAVRTLRERGTAVVYISHFLEEVLELADEVTVLRNGRVVRTAPAAGETPATLIESMLGGSLGSTFPEKAPPAHDAPAVLRVDGLTRKGVLHDVSFALRAGEILGVAGLVGSGRSEVARTIFGADRADAGTIDVDGRRVSVRSPRRAMGLGIALIPESRKDQGLVLNRSVQENAALAHLRENSRFGIVSRRKERRAAAAAVERATAPPGRLRAPVAALSGGNQQKVLFAKWLMRPVRVLLADEPTRGVDIGAKRSIYQLIRSIARDGAGVVLISSEIEEVLGLADRVIVMRGGRIVAELGPHEMTEDAIMRAAFGSPATAL
jgi:ABC-type sugar transport system ATPase subunit